MKALRLLATESLRLAIALLALLALCTLIGPAPSHALVENQSFGIFGVTPVTAQPSGSSQAAVTQTQDTLTDSTGGTPATTLAAITVFTPSVAWNGSSVYPSAADATSITAAQTSMKNSLASVAAELAKVKTDMAASNTLTNALRTALVNLGLIKGGA